MSNLKYTGVIVALFAILMQISVWLSPVFLSQTDQPFCIRLGQITSSKSALAVKEHRISPAEHLLDNTHRSHQDHDTHLLHNTDHTETHDIYLEHCDICTLFQQMVLLKTWDYPNLEQTFEQENDQIIDHYQSLIISPKAYILPFKHAPPIFT